MNEKHYPLHPGQDHVPPYYVQIPQSEYESLKRENEQLHELLQGTPKQSATAEIDTLASEVKALREMNVKLQSEKFQLEDDVALLRKNNEELKEERRWRKCSEEMPESDIEQYLVYDTKTKEYGKSFCSHSLKNFQFPVTHWMPMPKAPEVDNESNKV